MILVLSGGGSEARELSALLEPQKIPHLCVFSTFAEAGSYGRGNAVVGRMDRRAMEQVLRRESILGVVDATESARAVDQSRAAMAACRSLGVPYVKFLRLPLERGAVPGITVTGSYEETAASVNGREGAVLFYAAPECVRAVAARCQRPERLYTPILRGLSFDVELAMEFGIPLVNVLEMDGVQGAEAVEAAVSKTGAELLICDNSVSLADKAEGAERAHIPMILTHRMGVEYTHTALTGRETLETIRGWLKKA